jgi:hypothetical protein
MTAVTCHQCSNKARVRLRDGRYVCWNHFAVPPLKDDRPQVQVYDPADYFTAEAAGRELNYSGKAVAGFIKEGRITAVKFHNRWWIDPAEILRYKTADYSQFDTSMEME